MRWCGYTAALGGHVQILFPQSETPVYFSILSFNEAVTGRYIASGLKMLY